MSKSQLLPLPAGTLINDYEIIELLGSGGFGAVYKAKPRNGSFVAIKETYYNDEQERKMFQNEAKLLSSLSDEGFPKVIDHFGDEVNRYYLIMELIDGDNLAEVLKKEGKPIELNKVLDWANEILLSLEHLHSIPIIHRDIKLQNLKLTPRGRIKIIDLGIAKGYFNEGSKVEIVLSTPVFSEFYSPIEQSLHSDKPTALIMKSHYERKCEQVLAQGTDSRADIYSLGITLYRLLTNIRPETSLVRANSVWSGKNDLLIPAHEANKKIPLEISHFLHKAIEIERDNRYASVNEMREALNQAIANFSRSFEQPKPADFAKREKQLLKKEVQFKQPEPTQDWQTIDVNSLQMKEAETVRRQVEIIPEAKKEYIDNSPLGQLRQNGVKVFFGILVTTAIAFGMFVNLLRSKYSWSDIAPKVANTANNSVANVAMNVADKPANSANVATNSTLSADDYFDKAHSCEKKKDYKCAISNYSKAIELNPDFHAAYNNRGNAYSKRGNYDQAIKDYTKAIELKPDDARIYNNRGTSYDDKKDYDQAIKDFKKAVELNSDYAEAYNNRGFSYKNKKDYDAAIVDYQKALEIDPNNKLAKDNLKSALAEKAKQ
jgi:serine/threonine protein kinase/Flp pilus assembly protein TadD